jgi:hypothetical protein
MVEVCPHCGSTLPTCHDAFCPDCRQPVDDASGGQASPIEEHPLGETRPSRHFYEHLTLAGRILLIATLVLGVGGPWMVIFWLHDSLPPGSYSLWFFTLPVLVGSALLFGLAVYALQKLGIAVFRNPDDPPESGAARRETP